MGQLQLFTTAELAKMRDRTASRDYSPSRDEFRREHERRRAWGLQRRHAERLARVRAGSRHPSAAPTFSGDRQGPAGPIGVDESMADVVAETVPAQTPCHPLDQRQPERAGPDQPRPASEPTHPQHAAAPPRRPQPDAITTVPPARVREDAGVQPAPPESIRSGGTLHSPSPEVGSHAPLAIARVDQVRWHAPLAPPSSIRSGGTPTIATRRATRPDRTTPGNEYGRKMVATETWKPPRVSRLFEAARDVCPGASKYPHPWERAGARSDETIGAIRAGDVAPKAAN